MKHGKATVVGRFRGREYKVQTSAHVCQKCGHYLVEAEDTPELMRSLSDAYRSDVGLFTSDQIRSCRDSLGMSQQRFADYLKVGVASVKRWELGGVQDAANDDHMRLKCDLACATANIAIIRNLQNTAAEMSTFVDQIRLRRTPLGITAAGEEGQIGTLKAAQEALEWPQFADSAFAHSG